MAVPASPRETLGTTLVHGPGSPLLDLAKLCSRIARSDATVLITGETGTGKEVFARLVHEQSGRAGRPLVPVNCAAIPETLLESELFGFVKGAFTGAFQSRKGRIALAEGGTLFLDEIGELPLSLQAKLLRVLQERSYEPVGSTEPIPADFRLVVATNRDLAAEVEAGRFRRDLFYRLLVCPMELPPLRERRADITPLFLHFWRKRGETRPIAPAALAHLAGYDWPGNVRELENLVERLSICSEGGTIAAEDLPAEIRQAPMYMEALQGGAASGDVATVHAIATGPGAGASPIGSDPASAGSSAEPSSGPDSVDEVEVVVAMNSDVPPAEEDDLSEAEALRSMCAGLEEHAMQPGGAEALGRAGFSLPLDLPQLLRSIEDRFIEEALDRAGGNKKAAADMLGLQRTTLVEKLRRRSRDAAHP